MTFFRGVDFVDMEKYTELRKAFLKALVEFVVLQRK